MSNVYIIHGCYDLEEKNDPHNTHWIPWVKKTLLEKGFSVETPAMPEPWEPRYEKFKAVFDQYPVDENSILVGHSCGGCFLVRWLGDTKKNVKKLILVAPWKVADAGDTVREAFYTYPTDQTIADRVGQITMFTSNDEAEGGKQSLKLFHDALGGKIIDLPNHGHYILDDMGTEEFLELVGEITN